MADLEDQLISGEKVVLSTGKHWWAPVADSKWAILLVLAALLAAWLQWDATDGIAGFLNRILQSLQLGFFLVALGWIAYNVVAWRTAEYHVTNRRVLGHDGLIRSRSTDTLLSSVSDVKTLLPAMGRMLGYGTIRIVTASGDAGTDTFTTVKGVEAFKKEILEQKSGTAANAPAEPIAAAAPPPARPPAAPAQPSADQLTATLGELAKLRDAGAISEAEFDAKKAELLSRI